MSIREAFNSALSGEADVPADVDAVEADVAGTDESSDVVDESAVADLTEPADTEPEDDSPKYRAKVDGEEVEVTLEELLAGYSRTSDYTRKTQALAADRQRLAQAEALTAALASNPEETLRMLAESYGIGQEEEYDLDPDEARLRSLESAEAARQEAAVMASIDAHVANLHQQYGEFDDMALLQYAVDRDIADLSDAYKAMTFENVRSEVEATRAEAKRAADAKATAAKREAIVVEGGTSRTSAGTQADLPSRPSIREAYALATK